jgi:hypothetical protein
MSRNRSPARHRELDRNGGLVTEGRKLTMQAGQGARRSGLQVDFELIGCIQVAPRHLNTTL